MTAFLVEELAELRPRNCSVLQLVDSGLEMGR